MRSLLAASQPLQDIACLMVETGMRPEEVYRIRRENVHLEQGYLFNPYGKTKAARRKVWLNDTALGVLSRRLEKVEGDYLFPGLFPGRVEGKPIVKVNAAHTATRNRCGVAPFTLYSLRHTWATRAAESGVDLVTLAAMLGTARSIWFCDTLTRLNSTKRQQCKRSNNAWQRDSKRSAGTTFKRRLIAM